MKIKKAKLTSKKTLEVCYIDDDFNEISLKGSKCVHPDLEDKLEKISIYFADICEILPLDRDNDEELERIHVRGVSCGNDGNVVISGYKLLSSAKVLNLNTPNVSLNADDAEYIAADALKGTIDDFFSEVKKYMFEKKFQEEGSIEFADDPFGGVEPADDLQPAC